jgi:copper chaperone NosL
MTTAERVLVGVACVAWVACTSAGQQAAAVLDTRNDTCAQCRMVVSDQRFAAQIVAPGEEPRFFDDLGCLRTFLRGTARPSDALAYVADHRTKQWVTAATAVYVRNDQVSTPMGSHLLAHADEASRGADPDGTGAVISAKELFGPGGLPAGRKP